MENVEIVKLTPEHAQEVAKLHISSINTGFISSLGVDFVAALYEAIAESRCGFGVVACKGDKVIAFVAFSTSTSALYRSVLLRRGFRFGMQLITRLLSPKAMKRIFETLFYPSRTKKLNLPSAELLSIVVAEHQRGKGVASSLLREGLIECRRRGIDKLKVLVGAELMPANKFYSGHGFKLAGHIDNHGITSNVYVASTDHFEKR